MMDDETPRRAARRSTGESRRLIAEAASTLFEERGYHNTTTRDIAARAQVSETLIFRHYESKARLFRETVLAPFADDLTSLASRFDPSQPSREFFSSLFTLFREQRPKIMALLSVSTYDGEVDLSADDGSRSPIEPLFRPMEAVTAGDVEHYGFKNVDITLTTAIGMATLLGLVAFDDWLFGGHLESDRVDDLMDETLRQLAHGLAHRPPREGERRTSADGT